MFVFYWYLPIKKSLVLFITSYNNKKININLKNQHGPAKAQTVDGHTQRQRSSST